MTAPTTPDMPRPNCGWCKKGQHEKCDGTFWIEDIEYYYFCECWCCDD